MGMYQIAKCFFSDDSIHDSPLVGAQVFENYQGEEQRQKAIFFLESLGKGVHTADDGEVLDVWVFSKPGINKPPPLEHNDATDEHAQQWLKVINMIETAIKNMIAQFHFVYEKFNQSGQNNDENWVNFGITKHTPAKVGLYMLMVKQHQPSSIDFLVNSRVAVHNHGGDSVVRRNLQVPRTVQKRSLRKRRLSFSDERYENSSQRKYMRTAYQETTTRLLEFMRNAILRTSEELIKRAITQRAARDRLAELSEDTDEARQRFLYFEQYAQETTTNLLEFMRGVFRARQELLKQSITQRVARDRLAELSKASDKARQRSLNYEQYAQETTDDYRKARLLELAQKHFDIFIDLEERVSKLRANAYSEQTNVGT